MNAYRYKEKRPIYIYRYNIYYTFKFRITTNLIIGKLIHINSVSTFTPRNFFSLNSTFACAAAFNAF
jgi:hypothetical protein